MILLYGIPGDGPFEMVADAIEAINQSYVILDLRKFNQIDFILHISNETMQGELSIGHRSYPLSSFKGIYNRAIDFGSLPAAKHLAPEVYKKYASLFDIINQWIECCECKVVNKISAMTSNASKPYQLKIIREFFMVPDTLVTNNIDEAAAFEKNEGIIYKSASSVRSIVKKMDFINDAGIKNIRYCPTLFQKKLEGTNFRVHVVGNKVFAAKVESATIDYRYSNREGNDTTITSFKLNKLIKEKCIALAKRLQLPFAGIDLFLTNEGEWFCFEVNPSPGFSYFEQATGLPIAEAVAKYLM